MQTVILASSGSFQMPRATRKWLLDTSLLISAALSFLACQIVRTFASSGVKAERAAAASTSASSTMVAAC